MSIRLLWRRGLPVLAGAAAVAALAPAVASAATVSALTVSPTSVPAGSTSTDLTVNYTFAGGNPTSLVTHLPAGLLANGAINGGACLVTPASNTPPAACQIGTGLANGALPLTLYLVRGPNPSADIAGLEIVLGGVNAGVADVTSRTTDGGLDITFASLPPGLTSLSATFTGADTRMPTNCPGQNVSAGADGQATPLAASPALTVTGCSSLAYHPSLTATVKKDSGDNGAEVISTVTQPNAATESATKASTLGFGPSLSPNVAAIAACFVTPCNVGSSTATSPVLPNAVFTGGTVTLGGSITTPTLTITFPLLHLSLAGTINLTNNTVTFASEPDFPLTMLSVDVTGPSSGGKAFNTTASCPAANVTGAFTPWDGNAVVNASAPIQYQGCTAGAAGKPTAAGSISGLTTRHPKLKFTLTHGSNAPNLSSFSIGPSQGLSFRKCIKKGKKHLCSGVSMSSAVKSEKISGGRLRGALSSSASSVSVTAAVPALTESKALQTKVKKGKIKNITFTVKVKDATGKTSSVSFKVKA